MTNAHCTNVTAMYPTDPNLAFDEFRGFVSEFLPSFECASDEHFVTLYGEAGKELYQEFADLMIRALRIIDAPHTTLTGLGSANTWGLIGKQWKFREDLDAARRGRSAMRTIANSE